FLLLAVFVALCFFLLCYRYPRDLHSFPTRRSSDLSSTFAGCSLIKCFPKSSNNCLNVSFLVTKSVSQFTSKSTAVLPSTVIDVEDRKSTRLNSSHVSISYAVFCL